MKQNEILMVLVFFLFGYFFRQMFYTDVMEGAEIQNCNNLLLAPSGLPGQGEGSDSHRCIYASTYYKENKNTEDCEKYFENTDNGITRCKTDDRMDERNDCQAVGEKCDEKDFCSDTSCDDRTRCWMGDDQKCGALLKEECESEGHIYCENSKVEDE